MTTTRPLAVRFPVPRPSPALMAALGVVNRWCMLRWRFRVATIDFPRADRERLARVTKRDTAAFLAPNHPEFGLDWMIDKELSTLFAPRMAAWAAHDIIAGAPWFWLRNNLVSHRGGAAAIDYSVEWALRGNVVLLHPEGSVHWTSGHVHPLFPGIADMALETARRSAGGSARPVFIAPIVWRLHYTRDVTAGIHRDMAVIERALGLRSGNGSGIAERFQLLQEEVLALRMARFGFDRSAVARLHFFARQSAFRRCLLDVLLCRHQGERGCSIERTLLRLSKASLDRDDRARLAEVNRLGGFSEEVYDKPTLTQEEIGESLKRLRAALVRDGFRNALHNALPRPYGPRIAHVRTLEPIRIDAEHASGDSESRIRYRDELLTRTRGVMQARLDSLGRELAAMTDPFRHPNPFYRGPCPHL